jgi:hypothetical protein
MITPPLSEIIRHDYVHTKTCIGVTLKGARCGNAVAAHNANRALSDLQSPAFPKFSPQLLMECAGLLLCKRYHQDQASRIVSNWLAEKPRIRSTIVKTQPVVEEDPRVARGIQNIDWYRTYQDTYQEFKRIQSRPLPSTQQPLFGHSSIPTSKTVSTSVVVNTIESQPPIAWPSAKSESRRETEGSSTRNIFSALDVPRTPTRPRQEPSSCSTLPSAPPEIFTTETDKSLKSCITSTSPEEDELSSIKPEDSPCPSKGISEKCDVLLSAATPPRDPLGHLAQHLTSDSAKEEEETSSDPEGKLEDDKTDPESEVEEEEKKAGSDAEVEEEEEKETGSDAEPKAEDDKNDSESEVEEEEKETDSKTGVEEKPETEEDEDNKGDITLVNQPRVEVLESKSKDITIETSPQSEPENQQSNLDVANVANTKPSFQPRKVRPAYIKSRSRPIRKSVRLSKAVPAAASASTSRTSPPTLPKISNFDFECKMPLSQTNSLLPCSTGTQTAPVTDLFSAIQDIQAVCFSMMQKSIDEIAHAAIAQQLDERSSRSCCAHSPFSCSSSSLFSSPYSLPAPPSWLPTRTTPGLPLIERSAHTFTRDVLVAVSAL